MLDVNLFGDYSDTCMKKKFSIELSAELTDRLDAVVEQLSSIFPSRNALVHAILAAKFGMVTQTDLSTLDTILNANSKLQLPKSSRVSRSQQATA